MGSVIRKSLKAPLDGDVVELVRAAGAIPLLVSATPEFCMSFETNTVLNGRCVNPYNLKRTSAGSSGGEGALNGCGATPFGVGSDISGSIRLPAMFCGVYGHKPTGGLTSVRGHYPYTLIDENFPNMLQIGPITRFARDLPLLLEIMAGDNKHKLQLSEQVSLKDIKVGALPSIPCTLLHLCIPRLSVGSLCLRLLRTELSGTLQNRWRNL